jgi:hypothetical protein
MQIPAKILRVKFIGPALFLLSTLGFNETLLAQSSSAIEQDTNKWTTIHLNTNFNEDWFGGIGIHNRVGNDFSAFRRMRYRLLAGKRLNERWIVQAGLDRVENFNPQATENRTWQQIEYALPSLGRWSLSHRMRLEQRFIGDIDSMMLRSRHMISGIRPLGDQGKWYLVAWEELFINWSRDPQWPQGGFAQNRLFGGLGYNFNARSRFELGYQARFMPMKDRPEQLNHILFMQWFQNF